MKFLGLVLLIIASTSALPATTRSSSEPDECSKECINGVARYGQELSILRHSDLSNYFNKIDEVCEVITTARKCLERCGETKNPFALESLNIVCQPETQEKIDSIKQCLHYVDTNVNEICSKECGNDHIIDETDVTPKMNPMLQKANGECANFKCMARCNVEVVSNQCGKDLGKAFQELLQQVMDTQRNDLEKLNLVDTMAKTSPPECNYLYDPSILFGGKVTAEEPKTSTPPSDPKEDAKALYAQAQLQLLLKQLELVEKQDQLIERENAKLDMEMAYMQHKAQQRDQRFQAHALPTFVPMDKMPREPMTMESFHGNPHMEIHHPESMPTESHPIIEESHSEEPSHHEQMPMEENQHHQHMPDMESQQPSIQIETHVPMDFPHPEQMHGMPMEMPRHPEHKMPPVIINGMPMEFVPFETAPMEAMPRFL